MSATNVDLVAPLAKASLDANTRRLARRVLRRRELEKAADKLAAAVLRVMEVYQMTLDRSLRRTLWFQGYVWCRFPKIMEQLQDDVMEAYSVLRRTRDPRIRIAADELLDTSVDFIALATSRERSEKDLDEVRHKSISKRIAFLETIDRNPYGSSKRVSRWLESRHS